MVRIPRGRKSSYRLGRRLKASKRDRLDYITYLMTGAGYHGGHGGGEPTKYIAGTIDGGGLVRANLFTQVSLRAMIEGEGELTANVNNGVKLAASIDGGGEFASTLVITAELKASIDSGGEINANAHIAKRVTGTIDGGGDVFGHMFPPHRVSGEISGGGLLSTHIVVENRLRATIDGGGLLVADVPPAPVELAAVISGEGALTGNVTNTGDYLPETQAIIDAMVVKPSIERREKINDVVSALISNGVWAQLDCFYMLYAHTEQAATINWINPGTFDLVPFGTPTFVADYGTRGNPNAGVLAAYNSGFFPDAQFATSKLKQASGIMFVYTNEPTGASANGDIGINGSATLPEYTVRVRWSDNTQRGRIGNVNTVGTNNPSLIANGIFGVLRNNSGSMRNIQAGTFAANQSVANIATLGSRPIAVNGDSNSATNLRGNPRLLQAAGWGGVLSAAQVMAMQGAIDTFITGNPLLLGATVSGEGAVTANLAILPKTLTVSQALIVAGGGGGGAQSGTSTGSGGAGGGGVRAITTPFTLTPGTYPVVVGNGGASNTNGANSSFNGNTAIGGGAGGGTNNPTAGGSGGGGRGGSNTPIANQAGAAGTSGQGNAGGTGAAAVAGQTSKGGGGGGGATGAGVGGSGANPSPGGAGGAGLTSAISGASLEYGAGGGGGGGFNSTGGAGGGTTGGAGGGSAANGNSGTANRGAGGGGAGANATVGGSGTSGVVIIRYAGAPKATGGTITTVGSDTVHTFTASGNFVVTG